MNNVFIRSLPAVAMALGEKTGINIVVGAQQACTDGKTIYLPELPDTDEMWTLARGYIDHESAHIKETDMKQIADNNPFIKSMTNIIEDIRVETLQGNRYPGCAVNLRKLSNLLASKEDLGKSSGNIDQCFQNWVISRSRTDYLRHEGVAPLADKFEQELRAQVGDEVMDKTRTLLGNIPSLTSTKDAKDLANKIASLLKKEQKKAKSQNQDQSGQGGKGPSGDPQKGQSGKEGAGSQPGKADALNKILSTTIEAASVADKAAQKMQAGASQTNVKDSMGSMPGTDNAADNQIATTINVEQIRQNTVGLRAKMGRLVSASRLKRNYTKRSGHFIEQRAIHRLAAKDPRIFHAKEEKTAPNTAVAIVLDRSASMSHRMKTARNATFAIADALNSIPGVATSVAAFPSTGRNSVVVITPFGKTAKQTAKSYGISATGDTPMFEALSWARTALLLRQEKRKIILVITDGHPANRSQTKDLIDRLDKEGHEVMGVGIQTPVDHLIRKSTKIDNVGELSKAMFDLFTEVLSH